MRRRSSILIMLTLLLTLAPAVTADPLGDLGGSLTDCIPPPDFVPPRHQVHVQTCGEIRGACTYEVFPDRMDPLSGGSWGADVRLDLASAPGYTTFVSCQGIATLRSLHGGTRYGEVRGADMRLGLVIEDHSGDGTLAAREAATVYPDGAWALLELELEFETWALVVDAVPATDSAVLSVPMGAYNSPWVPRLSATDAISPADVAISGDLTDPVPLVARGAGQQL